MNVESIRAYCLSKKGVTETFPFDAETLVMKVMGKMFALIPLEKPGQMNLKCDPERALDLREQYEEIEPGWHMSKVHWNTIHFQGFSDTALLRELIDHSYELVVKSLKKKEREELDQL
ncbi:MAG: MmcQ/YjbR family DNA-binding protein [Bacteroidia bacterium]|nr:MmcQ/YjbR family DNA-binding protein [Bacteroidia bacterium]